MPEKASDKRSIQNVLIHRPMQREFTIVMIAVMMGAAVAVGISGLFMETHPDPDKAFSDGPNAWPLSKMKVLLENLRDIDALVKQTGFVETK